ncbi:MAG: MFS transporter [Hamadaea sp.]|nr:MFS transporter [Hamadaea sp.]
MAGRLLTPAFLALAVSELAYFVAVGIMIPVVPLYASAELDAGPVGVGVAVGAFSVTALVLRPYAGRLSDRFGAGRLMVLGGLLFAVVAAAHVLAVNYAILLALRVALGVGEAVYFVAGIAALADVAPPDRLGEALSYSSLSLYLGIALGPAIGERLVDVGGFPAAWFGAAVLAALACGLALRIPSEARAPDATALPLIPRTLIAPGLAFLAGLAGAAGFLGFAALHARDIGMEGAGTVLFTYGGLVIVCRLLFARTFDRHPAAALSAFALTVCAAGLALLGLVRVPAGLVGGAAVLALGVTFLTPSFYREMMARLPANRRGAAAATFSIFVDLGLGLGPVMFGVVARVTTLPVAFLVAATVVLLAAALVARRAARSGELQVVRRKRRPSPV